MAKVVNLNKVRKARAQTARRAKADQNAVAFGRTKAEKQRDAADAAKAARDHEGHKRET